jgi:hypothetical protein
LAKTAPRTLTFWLFCRLAQTQPSLLQQSNRPKQRTVSWCVGLALPLILRTSLLFDTISFYDPDRMDNLFEFQLVFDSVIGYFPNECFPLTTLLM